MSESIDEEFSLCEKIKNTYNCEIIENTEYPYVLYCAADIGVIFGLTNVRNNIKNFNESEKVYCKSKTKGGMQKRYF